VLDVGDVRGAVPLVEVGLAVASQKCCKTAHLVILERGN